jgi:intein/homing endonuclease
VISRSEHNRKVAINRWKNKCNKESLLIEQRSKQHPELKARLVGYLMGDGYASIRKEPNGKVHYTLGFFPDDEEMPLAFLDGFRAIYSTVPRVVNEGKFYSARKESQSIVQDLLLLGSFHSIKWVPPSAYTKEQRIEWLRAFFDCEAYVGKKYVRVESVSEQGLHTVKLWLKELDISSQLYTYQRKQKTWNINFILVITDVKDIQKFLKQIGFYHSRKAQALQQLAGVA